MTGLIMGIAAGVIGVLSGMGLGSAGLFVLFLTSAMGMAQTEAQGLNLIFYLCSAGASLLIHAKKQPVAAQTVFFLTVFAIAGVIPGVYLADLLNGDLLRKIFGLMLTVTGARALLSHKSAPLASREQRQGKK